MKRGEIWTANLNPSRGREMGRKMGMIRPVLIIQANELIDAGTPMIVVLPLTTQLYPAFKVWRVTVAARDRLKESCQVVVDQPRAHDTRRPRQLTSHLRVSDWRLVERTSTVVRSRLVHHDLAGFLETIPCGNGDSPHFESWIQLCG